MVTDKVIDLSQAKVTVSDDSPGLSSFRVISQAGSSTELFVENEVERDKWVAEIRKVIEGAPVTTSGGSPAAPATPTTAASTVMLRIREEGGGSDEEDKRSLRSVHLEEPSGCALCEKVFTETSRR